MRGYGLYVYITTCDIVIGIFLKAGFLVSVPD